MGWNKNLTNYKNYLYRRGEMIMAFFAIQVRTGQELKAKEMIKYLLKDTSVKETCLVKSIYALETYTEYVNDKNKAEFDISNKINRKDVFTKLQLDSMNEGLTNLKKQYQSMKQYTDEKSIECKNLIKQKIKQLTNGINEMMKKSKKLKALFSGYLLIELKTSSNFLPDNLWHLIHKCPVVVAIPSKYNIPAEEINSLFEKTETEPQIEVQFEEVLEYTEVIKKQKELVHEANITEDNQKEKEYLQQADELNRNIVSEINELKGSGNTTTDRVKAFIKNKKETVSMPVSLFYKLYKEFKDKEVLSQLSSIDFINRLQQLIRDKPNKVVLE